MWFIVFDSVYFSEIQNYPDKIFGLFTLKIIKILLIKYFFKNISYFLWHSRNLKIQIEQSYLSY